MLGRKETSEPGGQPRGFCASTKARSTMRV
jgi:hypothetical protein